MKTAYLLGALFLSTALGRSAQAASPAASAAKVPAATAYRVVLRDADQQVWQRETYEPKPDGTIATHVHRYTELATGLNYQKNGQWVNSSEQITLLPDGSAAATNARHQVYFPADIYNGVVQIVTPDGRRLQARPVGIAYDDGDNFVLIATLTNAVGRLLPSGNQVIYPAAFASFAADLVCTFRKSGFESDLVFREQPPTPASLGLNPKTTRLMLLTEFIDTDDPGQISDAFDALDGLTDETLTFGKLKMIPGKAFSVGGPASAKAGLDNAVRVFKQWLKSDGRKFLVESAPYRQMKAQLKTLPAPAVAAVPAKIQGPLQIALKSALPAVRPVLAGGGSVLLAAADWKAQPGVVLDYTTVDVNQTNYTFQGDMTYYVSGEYLLSGTTTIEGGTVIKMNSRGQLDIDAAGTLVCQTAPYRPAVFTSYNDNSVGENFGSGTPALADVFVFLNFYQTNASVHDLRFCYGMGGIVDNWGQVPSTLTVRNCQFVNGDCAVYGYNIGLYNVLIGRNSIEDSAVIFEGPSLVAENVTADYGVGLVEADYTGATVALTNCLVTSQPLIGFGSATLLTNSTAYLPAPSSPVYQVAGGGNYYLTNGSPYHNVGTANIDPQLLADLSQKTTYPPVVYANQSFYTPTTFSPQALRDTNRAPDLGYHYDPLDYAFGGCDVYTNITFTAGTAVGWYEDYGSVYSSDQPYALSLNDGANLVSAGTATQPCWIARTMTVQEGGNGNWTANGWMAGIMINGSGSAPVPQLNNQFTRWSTLANNGNHFRDNWAFGVVKIANSEFYSGSMGTYWPSMYFTNCLFVRDTIACWDQIDAPNLTFQNCTFDNGALAMYRDSWQDPSFWNIQNTIFDGTAILTQNDNFNGDTNHTRFNYNAYNAGNTGWQSYDFGVGMPSVGTLEVVGPNDVTVPNGFNWQTSWLGNFYLPSDSPLIDAGSTTADQLGLYHFTTQTNQVKETNSIVDIGYHYVATDAYGNPLDSNGDGVADYLADANGNGLVDNGESPWLPPPSFLTQPANQTVVQGSNATFSATAASLVPMGYQWYFNTNTLLAGATSSTLTLTNVQSAKAGSYRVVATNAAGATSSSNATLTVIVPPPAPTNLVAIPGDQQVSLSWAAVSNAAGYNVKQSLTNGGPYTVFTNLGGVSCVRTGLANGTTYYYVVSAINGAGEGSNSVQASATLLANYTNVAAGKWSVSGSWSATPGAPAAGGGSATALVFRSTATDNSTNDLAGAFLLNRLALAGTNAVVNAANGSSLLFTNNGVVPPLLTNALARSLTINTPVTLGNNLVVGVTNGGVVTINSSLTESVTGSSVTLGGQGTLILSNFNTYSGGTILNAGTLVAGSTNGALGTGLLILNGGTLSNTVANTFITNQINLVGNATIANPNALTISSAITNTGSLTKAGAGILTLSSSNNGYTGGTFLTGGTIAMGNGSASATNVFGPGPIIFSGSGALQPTYNSSGTVITNSMVVNSGATGTISSASAYFFIKAYCPLGGDGTLALSGASGQGVCHYWLSPSNTFTGTLYAPAGASFVGGFYVNSLPDSTNNIRLGDTTVAGGVAGLFGLGSGSATPLVFNQRRIEMIGTTVGAQIVNNNTNAANTITINTPLLVSSAGAKTLTLSSVVGPTNVWGGSIGDGNLGGNNSGAISLAKSGSGIWSLAGTNTYTGVTTISGGTLMMAGAGQLGGGNYTGNILNNGVFTYAGSSGQTLNGVISGTGSLNQSGSGILTLGGVNTYSGRTTINQGELVGVTGGSCSNSALVVAAGATNGVRILTAGGQWVCAGLTNRSGSALDFNFGGVTPSPATAPLLVSGNLAITNANFVVRNSAGTLTAGQYPLVKYAGTLAGNVAGATATLVPLPAGASAMITNNAANHSIDLMVKVTPAFSGLSSQTIAYGTTNLILTGIISDTNGVMSVYPANGDTVSVTINGHTVAGMVTNGTGAFSINFNDASLAANGVAGSPYVITYAYAGNGGQYLNAAANDTSTTLMINPATAIVSLGNLTQTYDGTAKKASATTMPGGLTVNLTYDGSSHAPMNAGSYTVVGIISDANYRGSATNTLIVYPATPTGLTTAPGSGVVNLTWNTAGGASTYNVKRATVSGGGYTTIQSNVATNAAADNAVSNGVTYYYVVSGVNGGIEGAYSAEASATLMAPPTIVTQPTNLVVVQGSDTVFSVTVAGTSPFSYQWYFNTNTLLVNATNAALTLTNVQSGNAGTYLVVATNAAGTTVSSNVVLTVIIPPTITTQPPNLTVTQGGSATFSVSITGTAPFYYQWCFNGTNLSGATNSFYSLANVQNTNAGNYTVLVSNYAGLVTSSVAILAIYGSTSDSDGNGLPDWWEIQYFGHIGVDPNADPDGDGQSNWQEYMDGTDPLNPASKAMTFVAYQPYNPSKSDVQTKVVSQPSLAVIASQQYVVRNGQPGVKYPILGKANLSAPWSWYGVAQMGASYNMIVPAMSAYYFAIGSPTDDWDYDGISDVNEALLGLDPNNPSSTTNTMLGHWSFDDTNAWLGMQGQVPLTFSNIVGVSSWNTNAVIIDSTNPAVLRYSDIAPNGNGNLNCRNGSISLWFSPDWNSGTGPGSQGRLLEMGAETPTSGWWSLYFNTNGTQLIFGTQAGGVGMTNLTALISWTSNYWHQIVLTYSPSNSSLYVDGQAIVTNGLGTAYYPSQPERANGIFVGSDLNGNNQARGVFDELETYNYPLGADDVAANYTAAIQLDSDGDGIPNILENQLGLNPYSYNSPNGLNSTNGLQVFTPLK